MADARDQNTPNPTPFDPGSVARGRDDHGGGAARSVKSEMRQGPQPTRNQPERSATTSGAAIMISSVLALLFGGAGAWAYERFLAQPKAERPPATSTTQGGDSAIQKDLARLEDRINSLATQYQQLQSRLESIPKPAPPPDLAPLEQKVARIDSLSQQVETIGKKLDPLSQQLLEFEHKITELDTKLEALRNEVSAPRNRPPASPTREGPSSRARGPSPGEGVEGPSPSSEKGESVEPAFEAGVSRFREGRYQEAYDIFRKLLQSHPDDARIWYYAALSYGLSSGDWGRATIQMFERGVELEKAGKPPKSVIDAALAGLTKETGKDWLDYYRRRA